MYNIYVHMYIRICLTFYLRNAICSEIDTLPTFVDSNAVDLPPVETSPPQYESCWAKLRVAGQSIMEACCVKMYELTFLIRILSIAYYTFVLLILLSSYTTTRHQVCFITYVYYYNKIKYSFGFFFIFPLMVR